MNSNFAVSSGFFAACIVIEKEKKDNDKSFICGKLDTNKICNYGSDGSNCYGQIKKMCVTYYCVRNTTFMSLGIAKCVYVYCRGHQWCGRWNL
jgi:hypothetical protein